MSMRILNNDTFKDRSFFIGGDLNLIRNHELDYFRKSNQKESQLSKLFEEFLIHFKLIDIWRSKHNEEKQFTYRKDNPVVRSRLADYLIISKNLESAVLSCDI